MWCEDPLAKKALVHFKLILKLIFLDKFLPMMCVTRTRHPSAPNRVPLSNLRTHSGPQVKNSWFCWKIHHQSFGFVEEPLHQSRAAASSVIKEPFITREINEEIKAVKVQKVFFFPLEARREPLARLQIKWGRDPENKAEVVVNQTVFLLPLPLRPCKTGRRDAISVSRRIYYSPALFVLTCQTRSGGKIPALNSVQTTGFLLKSGSV